MPERRAGERRGVEAGEGMEGIALDLRACHRGVDEGQIEGRVVPDEDRTAAGVGAYRVAHLAEHPLQRVAFRQRRSQGMPGIDARDRQRCRIEPCALEGLHVEVVGRAAPQRAIAVHVDEHQGDLEQRIRRDVEPARLHIDRHRQVTAKAPRHERRRGGGRHCGSWGGLRVAHAGWPVRPRYARRCARRRAAAPVRRSRKDSAAAPPTARARV